MRVLYSFPHPIGAQGIGTVAWHHVNALARAGVDVIVVTPRVKRPFASDLGVRTVSVLGPIRPRMLGRNHAYDLVDFAAAIECQRRRPDVVHMWPRAVRRTATRARRMGIPTVREAPSPYTPVAIAQARAAWVQLGLSVPQGHFHNISRAAVAAEDKEFQSVDVVIVGSPEAAASFAQASFPVNLVVNRYGFDPEQFRPLARPDSPKTVLFVGRGEPAKGIHVLLAGWLRARRPPGARLLIRGDIDPAVSHRLAGRADPSVQQVSAASDLGGLMATAHVLALPSFSEGSALVTYEALGAGLVPLVSRASGAPFVHDVEGLVHDTGDVDQFVEHLDRVLNDEDDWARLRRGGAVRARSLTWAEAGRRLMDIYADAGSPSREADRQDT